MKEYILDIAYIDENEELNSKTAGQWIPVFTF